MPLRQFRMLGLAAALATLGPIAAPSNAEIPQVDGYYWSRSTVEQKQAYLVGMANLLAVDRALKIRNGTIDEQAPLSQYLRQTDLQTIAAIQDRLDRWYAANPDKMNTPVLGVFWLGIVKAAG